MLYPLLRDTVLTRESCYGILKSTLDDKISTLKEGHEVELFPKLGKFERILSDAYENGWLFTL